MSSKSKYLWRTRVPGGAMGFHFFPGPNKNSFLYSDGWGNAFSALRLRKFDFETGEQLSDIRTHTAVRAVQYPSKGKILAATDRRLFLLDSNLKELQRWDKRVPRYSSFVESHHNVALLKCFSRETVYRYDLETGQAKRKNFSSGGSMFRGLKPRQVIVTCELTGEVFELDIDSWESTPLLHCEPFISPAINYARKTIALSPGVAYIRTSNSYRRTPRGKLLREYSLRDGQLVREKSFRRSFREVEYSADGTKIALKLTDDVSLTGIAILDSDSLEVIASHEFDGRAYMCLLDPDFNQLVFDKYDDSVRDSFELCSVRLD